MVNEHDYNEVVDELTRLKKAIVVAREGFRLVHDQVMAKKTIKEIDRILNKDSDIKQ